MPVKLGTDTIRTIAAFEKMTKVQPKDCIIMDDSIYFLVGPDRIGFVIGRNGSNIKEVSRAFGKNVRLFAYQQSPEEMLKSMVPTAKSIDVSNGTASLQIPQSDRVSVIGRKGRNIKAIREIMDRHFAIKHVKLR
jgi:NusA-like KH domain protein